MLYKSDLNELIGEVNYKEWKFITTHVLVYRDNHIQMYSGLK